MTIDEAITLLKFNNKHIADLENDDLQQLAEWLEELKAIKDGGIPIIHGKAELELHDKAIRNKALDDIVTIIKERVGMDWEWDFCFIEQIAEQLKAGVNNEDKI